MSTRVRNINYTGKDFNSFREQLQEFAKNYFPDSYSDFSVPSPGTMFMEMAAYVGDVLSFYQDVQVQETFLKFAKNPANLYAIAYMMGYRPKVTTVAEAELEFCQIVPARDTGKLESMGETSRHIYEPDWSKLYRIEEYSRFRSNDIHSQEFLLRDTVDFSFSSSYDPTDIFVGALDSEGNPVYYELYKSGIVFSGEVKETSFTFGEYKKFQTVELTDENIVGIISITDKDTGEEWTEVPFLGQDTVFEESRLTDSDKAVSEGTSYNLRLKKVDRRFTTRFTSKGVLQIQFGAGVYAEDSDEESYLPNPISLEPGTQDWVDRYDLAYDPSNFLFSKSYGLSPTKGSTLIVRYVVGGGLEANVGAETITEFSSLKLLNTESGVTVDLDNLDVKVEQDGEILTLPGLTFTNKKPASGGRNGDTLEEVRENSLRSFAEQKRVVTLKDYVVRALSMPQKFGTISKVHAMNEPLTEVEISALVRNPLAITLYVLSQDQQGHLTYASDTVKNNLRTYLSEYMMITDAVDIKDAYIVNIGVNYDIVLRPGVQARDVLLNCNLAIQDYMKIEKRYINEPINIADLYTLLDTVPGVQTVQNIVLKNLTKNQGNYSEYSYSIPTAIRNNVLYPSYDPCIFEIKYPDVDILGRAVTL